MGYLALGGAARGRGAWAGWRAGGAPGALARGSASSMGRPSAMASAKAPWKTSPAPVVSRASILKAFVSRGAVSPRMSQRVLSSPRVTAAMRVTPSETARRSASGMRWPGA